MPIYEYECRGCRSRFEMVQSSAAPTPFMPLVQQRRARPPALDVRRRSILAFTAPERVAGALRQLRRSARPGRVLDGLIDTTGRHHETIPHPFRRPSLLCLTLTVLAQQKTFEDLLVIVLSNDKVELTVITEGGAMGQIVLAADKEKINPLWNP